MENKGIYFTELTLQNVRCFGEEAVLKLSNVKGEWSRWNVILGDNGTGKTTLLQCLAIFEILTSSAIDHTTETNLNLFFTKKEIDIRGQNAPLFSTTMHAEFSNEKRSEYAQVFSSVFSSPIQSDNENSFIIGYGANRRISFQILSEKETKLSQTLFDDDAKLINTEEWLYQMEFAASRESEIKELAIKRRDLIVESLKNILPDVVDIRFKEPVSIDKPVPRLEFKTSFGWVGIQQLSYGYKTMVAWMVDVAAQMFKKYPNSDDPLAEPVIILVDEIDLHLHPKWQRQIFEFLETRFPKAQFIVTAHSPLIVQSAPKDANIIVLKKEQVNEDEYVVRIDNDVESVRNWRIDQIMSSDLFGLESSRNPEIEKQMMERKKLLQRDDLNKEEQNRLEELNEISDSLPTANNRNEIEAMDIIRRAAALLRTKQEG